MKTLTKEDLNEGVTLVDQEGNEFKLIKQEFQGEWVARVTSATGRAVGTTTIFSSEARFYGIK